MKNLEFRDDSMAPADSLFAQAYLQSAACRFALSALSNPNLSVVLGEGLEAASLAVNAEAAQVFEVTSDGRVTWVAGGRSARREPSMSQVTGKRLDVPLPGRNEPIGLLRLRLIAGMLSGAERDFLDAIASAMGHAMQRARDEAQARREETRFRGLVDAARDRSLIALDPDGRIVTWNRGAENLWGYREEDVVGRHVTCLYPTGSFSAGPRKSPSRGRLAVPDLSLVSRLEHAEAYGWFVNATGSPFFAEVAMSSTRDASGALVGFAHMTTAVRAPMNSMGGEQKDHPTRQAVRRRAPGSPRSGKSTRAEPRRARSGSRI
jgi:PAS domain-containing protein